MLKIDRPSWFDAVFCISTSLPSSPPEPDVIHPIMEAFARQVASYIPDMMAFGVQFLIAVLKLRKLEKGMPALCAYRIVNKTTYDVVAQDLWSAGYYDCKFYVVPVAARLRPLPPWLRRANGKRVRVELWWTNGEPPVCPMI